jgi:hypothetical protein
MKNIISDLIKVYGEKKIKTVYVAVVLFVGVGLAALDFPGQEWNLVAKLFWS